MAPQDEQGRVGPGYALLGAPLEFLLVATVMNAPGALLIAKLMHPETERSEAEAEVRNIRVRPERRSALRQDGAIAGIVAG